MIKKLKSLPLPLKIVAWLNIVLALWTGIEALAYSTSIPINETIASGVSVILCCLIVLGILQASKVIRVIVLVLSFLNLAFLSLGFLAALATIGVQAFMVVIPLAINGITVWGLLAAPSKAYFAEANQVLPPDTKQRMS
ncbi:MAG: hypothetical protein AAGJ81_16020 [Verrucomicrobiota bacterium]